MSAKNYHIKLFYFNKIIGIMRENYKYINYNLKHLYFYTNIWFNKTYKY